MGYLQPTEYENYGLAPDTTDDWITVASSLLDTYCRRASLSLTQYTERIRLVGGSQAAQLSYLPLMSSSSGTTPLLQVEARYARTRRGELGYGMEELWGIFNLPGCWTNLDVTTIDWSEDGSLFLPRSVLGLPFNEISVTYTAGFTVVPDPIKVACALVVKNGQSMAGTNVKSNKVDTLEIQYFSDSLVDSTVRTLMRPWVAQKLG